MKVTRTADCGNSPKNQLLETVAIALAAGDWPEIAQVAATDILWDRVGGKTIHGRDDLRAALEKGAACSEIIIEHALSHGRTGAVNGVSVNGSRRQAFCHVFEFGNAKGTVLKSVKTYSIGVR